MLTVTSLCRDAFKTSFEGKRILLRASEIYKGRESPPDGKENYLYLYCITEINPDCKSAIVTFAESYVKEEGDLFRDYPNTEKSIEKDNIIKVYCLSRFNQDHKRYNYYLSKEAMKMKEELGIGKNSESSCPSDTSIIQRKFINVE